MTKLFSRFRKNESGATAIEYGLIAGLIAVAIIGGATTLGDGLSGYFETIETRLPDAAASTEGGTTTP